MSRITGRNTGPERRARSLLHRLGFRFSLKRTDLPGRPDIVLPRRRVAIFVNGCFWHRHNKCPLAVLPKTRPVFWLAKLNRNVERDRLNVQALKESGWRVLIIWECELENELNVSRRLQAALRRVSHA